VQLAVVPPNAEQRAAAAQRFGLEALLAVPAGSPALGFAAARGSAPEAWRYGPPVQSVRFEVLAARPGAGWLFADE